jgi:hypothetical protein
MIAAALGEVHVVGTMKSRGGRQDDSLMPAVMQNHFSANHEKDASGNLFVGSTVCYKNLRPDEHLIWNVRDPRDTAISLWQIGLRGKWLKPCTLAEYLESRFCAEVVNAPDFGPSMSWGTYTKGWMEATQVPVPLVIAKHEMTIADREMTLTRILTAMDHSVPRRNVLVAIAPELGRQRLSYDGRDSFTLAGQPTWPKYFGSAEAQILDAHCGDTMRELGYGNEPQWLERL